jgi:hypothetical protein
MCAIFFHADYIPDESERDSVFQPPHEDDRVSLRSQSSSISTTTDDQASLLLRRDRDRLNSLERPPPAPSSGQRRVKSAVVTSALSRRKRGIQPIGEELEIIKAHLSLKIPRAADLGTNSLRMRETAMIVDCSKAGYISICRQSMEC